MKKNGTNTFSYLSEARNNKLIFLVVAVLVGALVLDTSLVRIYSYGSNSQSLSNIRIALFLAIATAYVTGQYLLLEFVKKKSREIRTKKQLHLRIIHGIVTLVQFGYITSTHNVQVSRILKERYLPHTHNLMFAS
jgi:hypothetical protein